MEKIVAGFIKKIPHVLPLECELWGIYETFLCIEHKHLEHVIVESDSLTAVDILTAKQGGSFESSYIVSLCMAKLAD